MEWNNQLTKTPYLVLFIILISMSVGTASALITITLSGNVIITDDLLVDGDTLVVDSSLNKVGIGTTTPLEELDIDGDAIVQDDLYIGTTTGNDWDTIYVDDGSNWFRWVDGNDRFKVSNDFNVDGVLDVGGQSTPVPYNRIGFHQTDHGLSGENDLFVHNDLEVDGQAFLDGDLQCNGCIDSNDISNGSAIKSISTGEWNLVTDGDGLQSTLMTSTSNSMCFLTRIHAFEFTLNAWLEDIDCNITDNAGTWQLNVDSLSHYVGCSARCIIWD